MRIKSRLLAALMLTTATALTPALAAQNPPAPPNPTLEFTAFLFIVPWAEPYSDTLDPFDINSVDILFDTIEDPLAFDNPPSPGG